MAAAPLLAAFPREAKAAAGIVNYRAAFIPMLAEDGRRFVVIRRFERNGAGFALTVDPATLETAIRQESWLEADAEGWPALKATPYVSALWALTSAPYPIENAGLKHARGAAPGYFLTVDMCPSRRSFEAAFFASLAERGRREGMPMPVAISISGYWAIAHRDEFASLIARQQLGELDVTWVNHSYTHRYLKGVPDRQNFMLTPHTDLESEVFRTEQLLIEAGLTPSVFFRFPGLVSDAYLVMELRRLGLVPLGADAWLAKAQRPRPGSIVLVHGNGNEPQGIADVRRYVADGQVRWMGLREAAVSD
ncbi:MAG: polysaccharide deacetylase [Parvibaculum sp.]|uniref:polysaccharide deacetylase family protein n=1 Tax=Parvibaculum sp. TaxID=2024848 RepID=UPI002847E02E|nr:polysaccharide deacetylase [Parvibaculum sp.]MDR3500854.1 polysaccharide deacetylase [Parvibaculum sp.]